MPKRIHCEESRILQREADSAECNEWHVNDAQRRIRDNLAESLFTAPFAEAWHLASAHFPWVSFRARRSLLDELRSLSYVNSCMNPRKKKKGGESFDEYGSHSHISCSKSGAP